MFFFNGWHEFLNKKKENKERKKFIETNREEKGQHLVLNATQDSKIW
jgi:hypothetical protein